MQISKHINSSEIACKCGCGFADLDVKVAIVFERIRNEVSKKNGKDTIIDISNGCRCGEKSKKHPNWTNHNKRAGSKAKNSRHIFGDALDLRVPKGYTKDEFYDLCDDIVNKLGGVGYYKTKNIVHIDTRGYHSRWGK